MSEPQATSRWPLVEGAGLVVVALACVAFQAWVPTTHVPEADYLAVAATLEREALPGDVVLLSPWWTERARMYLPERVPVVGFQGSEGVPLEEHPRIWVLAEPGLPRDGEGTFMAAFGPQRTLVGQARQFGKLSLRLFTNGRSRPVVWRGVDVVAQAQVSLEQADGSRQPCQWNGRAHQCPNGHAVAAEWHEVHFEPIQCLYVEAPGGSTKLVIDFPQAQVGSVLLRAGYIWEKQAAREGVTSSDVGLEVDGKTSVQNLPAGVEQPASRLEGPGGSRVRVWVTSANPTARQVCISVTAFGRAP